MPLDVINLHKFNMSGNHRQSVESWTIIEGTHSHPWKIFKCAIQKGNSIELFSYLFLTIWWYTRLYRFFAIRYCKEQSWCEISDKITVYIKEMTQTLPNDVYNPGLRVYNIELATDTFYLPISKAFTTRHGCLTRGNRGSCLCCSN